MSRYEVVGEITKRVINILGLDLVEGTKILCGESNLTHMRESHPEDFARYGDKISDIISSPTYICKHPKKDSIEYVKVFIENNDHVVVVVRASGSRRIYVRTIFAMSKEKVIKYSEKKVFIPY